MLKNSILAITLLALTSGIAAAQGTDLGGTVPAPTTPAPTTTAPAAPSSDGAFQKGTLGIQVPFLTVGSLLSAVTSAEPVPTIDFIYFLSDKAALDLIAGINLHKEEVTSNAVPPTTTDTTIFGFAVGAGYRMYSRKGGTSAFIEPSLVLDWPDSSESASLQLRLAGNFGLERMIVDWFSISGTIGGGLNFANSFKDIQLATQASLAANFYWK
jgi:hypothetical protein